jgi:N-acetylneuraminate synthase
VFLSSPFSIEALELLDRLGILMWKVASGEVTNTLLLERMIATRKPIILSTGMSALDDIDAAVDAIQSGGVELTLLQCTSAYPCPPEKVGLNMIPFFRERYGCNVGLSDHSGTIYPGLAAATLAISALEVHVTLSREMFGPDVSSSVTTTEMRQLVDGIRFIEAMLSHPLDKNAMAADMAEMRSLFTRSIVARHDLEAGSVLERADLAVKKPGHGMPPARLPELIGRRLRRSLATDQVVTEEDLESETQR